MCTRALSKVFMKPRIGHGKTYYIHVVLQLVDVVNFCKLLLQLIWLKGRM